MTDIERRTVIFDRGGEEAFRDPLSDRTLNLEQKLTSAQMLPGGRIAGAKPIGISGLPTNTAEVHHAGEKVLVAPEKGNIVVLGAGKTGDQLGKVIKKITSRR